MASSQGWRFLASKVPPSNEERIQQYIDLHGMGWMKTAVNAMPARKPNRLAKDKVIEPSHALPIVGGSPPSPYEIATFLGDDGGAFNVVVVDVRSRASFANYLVVATGRSPAHIRTLSESVVRKLRTGQVTVDGEPAGISPCYSSDWAVVDAGLTVIHLLLENTRERHNLEEIWKE